MGGSSLYQWLRIMIKYERNARVFRKVKKSLTKEARDSNMFTYDKAFNTTKKVIKKTIYGKTIIVYPGVLVCLVSPLQESLDSPRDSFCGGFDHNLYVKKCYYILDVGARAIWKKISSARLGNQRQPAQSNCLSEITSAFKDPILTGRRLGDSKEVLFVSQAKHICLYILPKGRGLACRIQTTQEERN